MTRIRQAIVGFLARPASPLPFGVLRIGLGLLLLGQALGIAGHLTDMFATRGLIQGPVAEQFAPVWAPRVQSVARALAPLGLDESDAIRAVFALHLAGAAAFLVGWHSRISAVSVWLTHLTLVATALGHTYGIDTFMRIALFFCVFAPVGSALSLDLLAGRTSGAPTSAARLALRVLQVELTLVYAATGIEKGTGAQWWNGEALWRSWMRADLGTIDFSWVAFAPWVSLLGGWATVVLEAGYPVFIWIPRTRRWWALGVLGLHAGIALTLGLVGFGLIMMLLTFCAWLVPAEPAAVSGLRWRRLILAGAPQGSAKA